MFIFEWPNIDTALEKILLQCLAPDQGPRFDSMRDIREALSNLPRKEACLASDENSCVQNSSADRTRFLEFANELCATLCANAVVDGNTATWLSSHEPGSDVKFQDLAVGAAGPVLALADLAAILRLGNSEEILAKGAHALQNADRPSANVLPGLYVGEAGIGGFLIHTARFPSLFPGTNDMAARAASTVSEGMRWLGSTRCHGLSGNIEFLLDMYQSTGENRYLAKADKLAELLVGQSLRRHGLLYWPSESPETLTPDYMVGYAGTAVCFLRLAFPESLPGQLSCENFARVPRSEKFLVSATTSREVSLTSRYQ